MIYKATVWKEIRENSRLRHMIAMKLDVGEMAVRMAATRESDSLTKYAAVIVIAEHMGVQPHELFETETAEA